MKTIIVSLFAAVILTGNAFAIEKQIKLTGGTSSFKYSDLSPGEEITLYGVSKGNSSNVVQLNIYGPKSVKVTASAARVKTTPESTLRSSKSFYSVKMRSGKALDSFHKECVDFSQGDAYSEEEPPFDPNSIQSIWDPICNEYSQDVLSQLAAALADTYGGSWDVGRACGYIVYYYRGGAGDGELPIEPTPSTQPARLSADIPQTTSTSYAGIFSKNACGSKNDKYLFRVKVKLPKTIPSSGYLRVRIVETKHYGENAATIKPVSDGMYAPQPLLLMSYLGFCGQKINIVKWRSDKPSSVKEARVYDLIHYRDLVLTRTPISSYLTGGQASVDLYDQNSGYGVCFELVRSRQRVNGYPE